MNSPLIPSLTRRTFGLGLAAGMLAMPRLLRAEGSTAVLGIDGDPPTLNPALSTDYAVGDVGAKIFEGLVWLDRNYVPQPSLATSWSFTPDGKTYTFKLRPGVKWHDGQDFTSADVQFTFLEVLAKLHPRAAAMLKRLDLKVETPDPLTAVLTLKTAYAPLLVQLSVFDAPILPRHLYAGTDIAANPANQKPVGTGPFTFVEWNRGASIKLTRNPAYWNAPLPYLGAIAFQIVPQPANRATALEAGDIDSIIDFYLPKPDMPRLLADKALQHRQGGTIPAIFFMTMNLQRPLFAKVEARHAMALAIDRDRLVKQAMGGLARPGYGAFGDGFAWMKDDADSYPVLYPPDPAKAKALLATAGYIPGTPVSLVYDSARPQLRAAAQIIRENLRQIGMEVQLEALERSVQLDKVFVKRDFDLTLQSYFSAGDPAIGYHRLYLTNTGTAQLTNASGYSNPAVDTLLGEAATEPDRDKRAAYYRDLQKILGADLPSLVLFDEETVDFATKKLTGLWKAIDPRDQWGPVKLAG